MKNLTYRDISYLCRHGYHDGAEILLYKASEDQYGDLGCVEYLLEIKNGSKTNIHPFWAMSVKGSDGAYVKPIFLNQTKEMNYGN